MRALCMVSGVSVKELGVRRAGSHLPFETFRDRSFKSREKWFEKKLWEETFGQVFNE